MKLSRRQFIGVASAVVSMRWGFPIASEKRFGRTLHTVSLNHHTLPVSSATSPLLLANSPLELIGKRGDYFITPLGDVPQIAVQPMPKYRHTKRTALTHNGSMVEVISTHAPLYQYASYDSVFLDSIGHGGILHQIDRLSDAQEDWILVADVEQNPLGWSPAQDWEGWKNSQATTRGEWVLNRTTHQLILTGVSNPPIVIAINYPTTLPSGTFPFTATRHGGHTLAGRLGVPCIGTLTTPQSEVMVHGVYWHNQYGIPHESSTLEVSMDGARWLRTTLSSGDLIRIV